VHNIKIVRDLGPFNPEKWVGFFEGWPNPPNSATLYELLLNSPERSLAVDTRFNKVVGFTYAISDKLLSAYIPLLEVLPEWRVKDLGRLLIEDLLIQLRDYYMVDVCCDESLSEFYEKVGFQKAGAGMIRRNYRMQAGRSVK
jgi:GNAT superfamily N-acetyltransferase